MLFDRICVYCVRYYFVPQSNVVLGSTSFADAASTRISKNIGRLLNT
jgi:hypothetical protein